MNLDSLYKYLSAELGAEYSVDQPVTAHLRITKEVRSSVEMSLYVWDITLRDHTGMFHVEQQGDISRIELGFYRSKRVTDEFETADVEDAGVHILEFIGRSSVGGD